ncbi:DUF192 domain-containing protein [Alteromonadaceae bacterium M269]|nr:DUF192 domain-containing protein [Alteromonadaceae bacterium M269]
MTQKNSAVIGFVSLMFALYTAMVMGHSRASFEKATITIGKKELALEYANTPELRSHGLQHRKVMCDDCGMLFKFEESHIASFWMKDTFLPLDIAFVTADGHIIRIAQMQPFEMKMESSKEPVLYAIEMHQGWFAKNNVKVGDIVDFSQITQ